MAGGMQDERSAYGAATARPAHEDRYDPLGIALRNARDAFDPDRAVLERRAATAPLIWYIEDTPDMGLPRPGTEPEVRIP